MKDFYHYGDRVASLRKDYHYGIPGTVVSPIRDQRGNNTRFTVMLDSGEVITLAADQMGDLPADQKENGKC